MLIKKEPDSYFVALRPICDALNVVYTGQLKRIKNDVILGPALYKCTMQAPSFSEKSEPVFQRREMLCLPEKYIYGWIFSINSDKEELIKYKQKCYDLLYEYFHGSITGRKDLLLKRKAIDNDIATLKEEMKEQDEKYKKLKALEANRKLVSQKLNQIDNSITSQYEMQLD